MSPVPVQPKLYHITHVNNLETIVRDGELLSDATVVARGGPSVTIGMSAIKKRRLEEILVSCHHGTCVGDYVPFYFCPRSVMLYLLHQGNHQDLTYHGGQQMIVHLEADLHEVATWADGQGRRWAFTLSNAGARYVQFRDSLGHLDEVNWPAVAERDFRSPDVKEGKQAEFLVHGSFPMELVRRIGVYSMEVKIRAEQILAQATYRPPVEILRDWYY